MYDRTEIPILVVDDDEELLEMVLNVLKHAGFKRLSRASKAEEALAALALPDQAAPDSKTIVMDEPGIVILDVMLPDKTGFELCKEIKAEHPDSMALMISGFDIEGLNEKLVDSEADDFLTKPFSALELVARVEMLAAKMRRNVSRAQKHGSSDSIPAGNRIPHIGDLLGNYMILDSLGWGKNSVIYKVVRKGDSEIYAIKLLTKYSMEFRDVVKRFDAERRILAKLSHPNIIKFVEAGVWDGCPFIVMECVRGINLEERLVTDGLPDLPLAIAAAKQLGAAVGAMHKLGALHRDIKLKNVMYEPDSGQFKLTDFGIAKLMDNAPGITCDGFIVGTPIYMAPEIFRGDQATVASDVYSFGATIYHFSTGAPPFSAKRNSDMYKKHLTESPKPMHSLNPAIPKAFDQLIVGRCMAKAPEDRPQSMDEILAALNKLG